MIYKNNNITNVKVYTKRIDKFIMHDMSGFFHSTIFQYCSKMKTDHVPLDDFRGLILDRIEYYNKKFKKTKDSAIFLVFDSKNGYWKKDIFQYYKAKRKKIKESDGIDWNKMYEYINIIIDEFIENLPYYCLRVDNAEADDIIATIIIKHHDMVDEIIITSSDQDFIQLQDRFKNVKQFSLKAKDFINKKNTNYSLFEHIVKGDEGDGIPNILSSSDSYFTNTRCSNVYKKDLQKWSFWGVEKPEQFCKNNKMLDRFKENRLLVDLTMIPDDIMDKIEEHFINYRPAKLKLMSYLVKNKLMRVIERM